MILHTYNKSPTHGAGMLETCLAALAPGDSLLLLEDGVYGALPGFGSGLRLADIRLYVLAEDLAARGISARIPAEFSSVTCQQFVTLCLQHSRVVNWS